jgi:G3E family GTPase
MIPLVLITGFLGSGKTTLLRSMLTQARSRRLVCIVNEFGSVDIDGQLLHLPAGQLVSIPGGSIFCHCLVGEFVRVLGQVATVDGRPEGVIVEASGIADPKVVARMLAETKLDATFNLQRIVTVVDPGSFHKLLQTLPAITAQVEASDLVLINKTDLYDAGEVDRTEERIRQINPRVRILRTQYGRMEIDLFGPDQLDEEGEVGEVRDQKIGEYAQRRDPHYITRTISLTSPVDPEGFLEHLRLLQPHIYRAKGFVPTASGPLYVDVSAAGVASEPAACDSDLEANLVIIAPPECRPQIDAFARTLGLGPSLSILS